MGWLVAALIVLVVVIVVVAIYLALKNSGGDGKGGGCGGDKGVGDPKKPCPEKPKKKVGNLEVEVIEDPGGAKIDGAEVTPLGPENPSAKNSDASGIALFSGIEVGSYNAKVTKSGYQDGGGGATVEEGKTAKLQIKLVRKVDKITAKIKGTKGKRDATKKRADNTLTASTSDDKDLTANAPVVLVRCNKDVFLAAETTPADQPVTWKVEANKNKVLKEIGGSPPTITPTDGGKKATLKCDKPGSFSVIAELGGSKKVWNVVFVWVKVNVKSTNNKRRNNKFADAGSNAAWTSYKSGDFAAGKFAFEGKVKMKLFGGGDDKKLGIDKVTVRVLQNGIADTLTGNYEDGGTALEVPKGGLPVVDSNGGANPFIFVASCAKITPNQTAANRTWWTGDSPTGSNSRFHQNHPTKKLLTITGVNGFSAAVASTANAATGPIIVHAKTDWTADYKGKVDYGKPAGAVGKWKKDGAKVTKEARFKLVSSATGGMDACDAGFEVMQPRFNEGTNTTWSA